MRKVKKPWGHEIIWAETGHYVGKILHIDAGQRLSLQYHNLKEETVYVLEGTLILWDGKNEVTAIGQGRTWHNKPGDIHRFCAPEDGHTVLLEVSTPHLDDVVRIEDDYKRT